MHLIMIVILLLLAVLLVLSRKETDGRRGRTRPSHRIALFIYRCVIRLISAGKGEDVDEIRAVEDEITKNLKAISVGESVSELRRNYYVDKIELTLLIILVGAFLGTCDHGSDRGLIIFLVSIGTGVVVFWAADKDLKDSVEARKREMKQEYPRVVQLLTLYVGAGMTVRGAINRITAEYGEINPIYQELKLTCREMQGGIPEGEAYERFGHRTGVREYIQLSMLLNINLRRGGYDLIDRLTEEALHAQNDRLLASRRLGEELTSKLLMPMMMYLGMVMVMIIIPAFSSI